MIKNNNNKWKINKNVLYKSAWKIKKWHMKNDFHSVTDIVINHKIIENKFFENVCKILWGPCVRPSSYLVDE